jgi:hypothetical protein
VNIMNRVELYFLLIRIMSQPSSLDILTNYNEVEPARQPALAICRVVTSFSSATSAVLLSASILITVFDANKLRIQLHDVEVNPADELLMLDSMNNNSYWKSSMIRNFDA